MNFFDACDAIEDAKKTERNARKMTGQLASLCAGRLRSGQVSFDTLTELKKELQGWNMRTNKWKD